MTGSRARQRAVSMAAWLVGAVLATAALQAGAATRRRLSAGMPVPAGTSTPFPIIPAGTRLQHSAKMPSAPGATASLHAGRSTPAAVQPSRGSPAAPVAGPSARTLAAPRRGALPRPASAAAERAR
jgi:hypothetical protein